ncbi:MAG: ribosomal L7Ae/L30e/S12e/Gadd45 family protein [Intestinibaculum porci]|jgi:ribosomal protein L7Ae-like RNA K-turn-binding protein|nr:ribosomal L7Ae/L30e/S12e/Gadd45 family protein [Intestinibaculum porci]HAN57896.1 50S ribosomal protein L7ae [Erysipelotrichaceae bacterium]
MSADILNYIGLAARARKVATGETALKAIQSKKASFVIIASDASDNTKKKFSDKCKFYDVDYVIWNSADALSHAIGKNNRMVIAILDRGFAQKLKEKLGG